MRVCRHGTFQSPCDEDDPKYQPDPQRKEKGEVKSADGAHRPVVQSQKEQQIGHADPGKDEGCRGDKPGDKEKEKSYSSSRVFCIEEILREKSKRRDRDQPQYHISRDPPGEFFRAGLPDDQRDPACHSADKEVEHGHGIALDELQERIGKKKDACIIWQMISWTASAPIPVSSVRS